MKTFVLTFDEQDLTYISRVLGAQPYAEVSRLIAKIQAQVAAALAPTPDPAPEAKG